MTGQLRGWREHRGPDDWLTRPTASAHAASVHRASVHRHRI